MKATRMLSAAALAVAVGAGGVLAAACGSSTVTTTSKASSATTTPQQSQGGGGTVNVQGVQSKVTYLNPSVGSDAQCMAELESLYKASSSKPASTDIYGEVLDRNGGASSPKAAVQYLSAHPVGQGCSMITLAVADQEMGLLHQILGSKSGSALNTALHAVLSQPQNSNCSYSVSNQTKTSATVQQNCRSGNSASTTTSYTANIGGRWFVTSFLSAGS